MYIKINNLYDCDVCSLQSNCLVDRTCFECGEMKKAIEWCIKKSEILCVSCFEKGNYEPLYLIKEKLS